MALTIALFVVATVMLAGLELWLFWRISGRRRDREAASSFADRTRSASGQIATPSDRARALLGRLRLHDGLKIAIATVMATATMITAISHHSTGPSRRREPRVPEVLVESPAP